MAISVRVLSEKSCWSRGVFELWWTIIPSVSLVRLVNHPWAQRHQRSSWLTRKAAMGGMRTTTKGKLCRKMPFASVATSFFRLVLKATKYFVPKEPLGGAPSS